MSESLIWSIFFVPLTAFVILGLIVRPFFNKYSVISGPLAIIAIGTSFVLSLCAFWEVMINENHNLTSDPTKWMSLGNFDLTIGILLDPLTAIMLVVVTAVSLMVQIYSVGYMKPPNTSEEHHGPVELGQPVYARYFAYMCLFTSSMLGLIMAANVVQLFVFWELVGLSSYLLIGFWFHRPAATAAAKKAFIVTRVGDLGFLIALMYLFFKTSSNPDGLNYLEIQTINNHLPTLSALITGGGITFIALGIFVGAIGKSGQFPLHTWLPDAMEGPTPVSALIHAATMVAAGVFLVGRFFPLFQMSETAMIVIALIGGFTAIFAASMGIVANDIKRVLAYSTVSQLGYMMLALGVGAYEAAIFHLFTHAFFKALLFLGSGSVNHATGTFDMRFMGGLRKKMPITYITFIIGSLSLAGIFPLAGFWSKDEILLNAFKSNSVVNELVLIIALIAVFMTAFYMFRAIMMTFEGEFRGGSEKDENAQAHGPVHLAESPFTMVLPMVLLTVPAVIVGYLVNPLSDTVGIPGHWMAHSLGHALPEGIYGHAQGAKFNIGLATLATVVAFTGIFLAVIMYKTKPLVSPKTLGNIFGPIHTLLLRKYYLDELYENQVVMKIYYRGIAQVCDWFDKNIVDRTAVLTGWIGAHFGVVIRQFQNGQIQMYATVTSIGVIIIMAIYMFGT